MVNIHLSNDEKFINDALEKFEMFYPTTNYFLVNSNNSRSLRYVVFNSRIISLNFENTEKIIAYIIELSQPHDKLNIFIHYLDYQKSAIISGLKLKIDFKIYWIFYGADLYNILYRRGTFKLYDAVGWREKLLFFLKRMKGKLVYSLKPENKVVADCIAAIDYFCFWNRFDYDMLKNSFATNAIYKSFIYDTIKMPPINRIKLRKRKVNILINHSASPSGNHIYILQEILKNNKRDEIQKLIVPLNYGSDKIKEQVENFCLSNFSQVFEPLLEYLSKEDYFDILNSIDIAFFGHKRQQGGFNIIYLLASGSKVFLRRDNSLYDFFQNLGIKVFPIGEGIGDIYSFNPLSEIDQKRNRVLVENYFGQTEVDQMYRKLLVNN